MARQAVAVAVLALLSCALSHVSKTHHAEQLRLDVRGTSQKNKGLVGNSTAVIFRTHVLDASVLALFERLLKDLAWSRHVCFMYDRDKLSKSHAQAFVDLAVSKAGVSAVELFGTAAKDYRERYTRHRLFQDSDDDYKLKYYHPEVSFILWWQKHQQQFRWIYGVEYDVGYTGNLSHFLDAHDHGGDERDLLAYLVGWRPFSGWWAWSKVSKSAKKLVDNGEGAAIFMPVVRYSNRMLELLDNSYLDGVTGYCEAIQASICNATSWCSFGNFSHEHVTPLFGFSGGLSVTVQSMREFSRLYPHHFFHPVRPKPASKVHGGEAANYAAPLPTATSEELLRTLCLLANPPPIAWGRYDCPIGCPNHAQHMCDMKAHYECLWDHPELTMTLTGGAACLTTCQHTQGKHCPLAYEQIRETMQACTGKPDACALRDADALLDGLRHSDHASDAYRAGEFGAAAQDFGAHLGEMKQLIFKKRVRRALLNSTT